jgi:hypothetical protein
MKTEEQYKEQANRILGKIEMMYTNRSRYIRYRKYIYSLQHIVWS